MRDHSKDYFAHSKEGEGFDKWQTLPDHLLETASRASDFAAPFNLSPYAEAAGKTHDLGKYSNAFQERIRGGKLKVDHSTAGAAELLQLFAGNSEELLAKLLAYCIIGHHTGLPDHGSDLDAQGEGTLLSRLKADLPDYSAYRTEFHLHDLSLPLPLPIKPLPKNLGFSLGVMTRMIYSCLVDADFQDTQTFMKGPQARGGHETLAVLRDRLMDHLKGFANPAREINKVRNATLQACVQKAALPPGFFSLTLPTGGGKTLATLAFALNHAVTHGLSRVIYVIPYTSIIDQNAKVFKDILGEQNVLEHHSNFDWDKLEERNKGFDAEDETSVLYNKLRLASENWDIPVVVTTNVQFFESCFANRSSRCRKLHNIANSVVIFDEAQMLPREFMQPTLNLIWELVTNYRVSTVFCTATQPRLERFLPAGTVVTELADSPVTLFDFYRRVNVVNLGRITDQDLLARLNGHNQSLCIVNTRRHAQGLYQGLKAEGSFHLSTLMCPAHRGQVLEIVRGRLKDGLPCRVVSTSVLEAGVDLDFPVGYRALAGLDSINQAAGRVNREMRGHISELNVFEADSEFVGRLPAYLRQTADVARSVLRDHAGDPISIAAIDAYYAQLYGLLDPSSYDNKRIMACFGKGQPVIHDFAAAAEKYRLIEEDTQSVIIPYDIAAIKLMEDLKYAEFPRGILRKLQLYSVNIYRQEYERLNNAGAIIQIADAYPALSNMAYYSEETGITLPGEDGNNALIF